MSADREKRLEPGELWSFWEIMQWINWTGFMDGYHKAATTHQMLMQNDQEIMIAKDDSLAHIKTIKKLRDQLRKMRLVASARSAERAIKVWKKLHPKGDQKYDAVLAKSGDIAKLQNYLSSMCDRIIDELKERQCFILSADEAELYNSNGNMFGEKVLSAFPEIAEDLAEAEKCFAFGRFTASVFHMMRALEKCAQVIAKKLGAKTEDTHGRTLAWGVIAANMKPIIDGMKKGSDEQVQWYRVQAQLEVVNRAWRVPTAHPKQTYTEDEAENIFSAVRSFLSELAPLA